MAERVERRERAAGQPSLVQLHKTLECVEVFAGKPQLRFGFEEVDRGGASSTHFAGRGATRYDLPLVVLVDGGTASMGEIFASALQEHGAATILGSNGPITASLLGLDGQPTQTIPIFRLPGLSTGAILLQTNVATSGQSDVTVQVLTQAFDRFCAPVTTQ